MSSSATWYNWRVIITATQLPAFILRLDTQGAPTVGPNGEPIDTTQSRVIDQRASNSVSINEMGTITGQRYQVRNVKVVAPPNQLTTVDTSLPFDINLIAVRNIWTADMGGDLMSWLLAPNTVVGGITQNVNIGDTVINVSPTVIANIDTSWRFRIISASNSAVFEDIGNVVSINTSASTVTLSTAATQAHTAGDEVAVTGIYCDAIELPTSAYVLDMGLEIPRVAYLPAGRVVRCEYTNNGATTKTFYAYYSFYYGTPQVL